MKALDEQGRRQSGATARAFHEATKHSYRSVRRRGHFLDWDNKPHPFKVYEGLERVPLPTDLPELGVSALDAIAAVNVAPRAARPDLSALARILVLGAGVRSTRRLDHEVFHFRTYASAGALYPVEAYVACEDLPDLPAGVYHFEPATPALVRLRAGDHRGWLARSSGWEPAVAAAPVVVALTGIPWRTAWKYGERGYRHLFWDAGMVLANVLGLAASAGLQTRVVLGFVDEDVEVLLGLDGVKEFPLCLVPLGSGQSAPEPDSTPRRLTFGAGPLSDREMVFEAITEANDAGRLSGPDEVGGWRESGTASLAPSEVDREPPRSEPESTGGPQDPLETVIRRRGSARRFDRTPIPAGVLVDVLDHATRGVPTDYAPRGSRLIELYLIANNVDGLAQGAYAFRDGGFLGLAEGDYRREAGYLCLEQRLAADAAATVFFMADLERVLDALGDRGYRAVQLEAGIVGGKLYLGAYAHRFGATGLTFYDDDVTEFFSPDAAGKSCMLVVAIGGSPRLKRRGSSR
ncbi:MAG: SagB/ThcOx family dehydrogenase [Actinomycetota bacterium]